MCAITLYNRRLFQCLFLWHSEKMNLPFLGTYFPNLYFYSIEKGGETC
nr:MAG TPA: hypothetical protein [Caudoviricetes sp.]